MTGLISNMRFSTWPAFALALIVAAGSARAEQPAATPPKRYATLMGWQQRRLAYFETLKGVRAGDKAALQAYDAILTEFGAAPLARTPVENMDILGDYFIPREGVEKGLPVVVMNAVLGWYDALRFGSLSGRKEILEKEKFFLRPLAVGGIEKLKQATAFLADNPDQARAAVELGVGLADRARDAIAYDRQWPLAYGTERIIGLPVDPMPRAQWARAWAEAVASVHTYYLSRPNPTALRYTSEVRQQSKADPLLFRDLVSGPHGMAPADIGFFPHGGARKIAKIEVLEAYAGGKAGVERWTIVHADGKAAAYTIKLAADGKGGTDFSISLDPAQ